MHIVGSSLVCFHALKCVLRLCFFVLLGWLKASKNSILNIHKDKYNWQKWFWTMNHVDVWRCTNGNWPESNMLIRRFTSRPASPTLFPNLNCAIVCWLNKSVKLTLFLLTCHLVLHQMLQLNRAINRRLYKRLIDAPSNSSPP